MAGVLYVCAQTLALRHFKYSLQTPLREEGLVTAELRQGATPA